MNILNGRYYYHPGAGMEGKPTEVTFREWRIEAAIPIELKNGHILGIKPQYKSVSLAGSNSDFRDLKLNSLKTPVFAIFKFRDPKWSVYADISPKLNSDFENIDSRHFQIGGMFIFFKERKQDFFWQFGMIYNQDTYGPFVMPLFGIDWQINANDYFAALLPAYLIYEHCFGERIYAGFELELSGETFRLGGSEYENSFISQVGENKLTFLTEPHLFLDYYLAKHVVLYLKPGMRLFQKYEHYTSADERISDSEYSEGQMKNYFYFEAGLAFRFRYDEHETDTN
jgi:hypothetical protein